MSFATVANSNFRYSRSSYFGTFFLNVLTFVTLCLLPSVFASLNGTISAENDHSADLTVVAVSKSGQTTECAPVISQSFFTLRTIEKMDDIFVLYVSGSTEFEYNSIIAEVRSGKLISTFERTRPKDFLTVFSADTVGNKANQLHFSGIRATTFRAKKTSWTLWDIPFYLWHKKWYAFMFVSVLFILWFPRIFEKLPKEMREELTGEKEPDWGDPNRVVKSLIAR